MCRIRNTFISGVFWKLAGKAVIVWWLRYWARVGPLRTAQKTVKAQNMVFHCNISNLRKDKHGRKADEEA